MQFSAVHDSLHAGTHSPSATPSSIAIPTREDMAWEQTTDHPWAEPRKTADVGGDGNLVLRGHLVVGYAGNDNAPPARSQRGAAWVKPNETSYSFFASSAAGSSAFTGRSTSSMMAMSAASPLRKPPLRIRV